MKFLRNLYAFCRDFDAISVALEEDYLKAAGEF